MSARGIELKEDGGININNQFYKSISFGKFLKIRFTNLLNDFGLDNTNPACMSYK